MKASGSNQNKQKKNYDSGNELVSSKYSKSRGKDNLEKSPSEVEVVAELLNFMTESSPQNELDQQEDVKSYNFWSKIKTVDSETLEAYDPILPKNYYNSRNTTNHILDPSTLAGALITAQSTSKRISKYIPQSHYLINSSPDPTSRSRATQQIIWNYKHIVPEKKDSIVTANSHRHELAVQNGSVFIPSNFRTRKDANSFESTRELGPPGAMKRWIIHMEKFRDNEITLTLEGSKLTIQGNQSTRQGQARRSTEVINLPANFLAAENLRVYRNKILNTVVVAFSPSYY